MMNPFPGIFQEIVTASALLCAAFGAGTACLGRSDRFSAFVKTAAGIIVLGWLFLFCPVAVSRLLWLVPAVYGAWALRDPLKEISRRPLLFFLTLLFLAATAAAALLPPSTWDEQVYQTALLRRSQETGFLAVFPDNPYSAYPHLVHSFLLPAFSAGGYCLPTLVIWLLTGIVLSHTFVTIREKAGKAMAALAVAVLYLSPLTLLLTEHFYAEMFLVLFLFAGWEVLTQKEFDARNVWLAGVLAAGCCAVKWTGGGCALAIFLMLLWRRRDQKTFFQFAGAAAVTFLPFLLRIALAHGNPFYPFGSGLLAPGSPAAAVEIFYHRLGNRFGMDPVSGTLAGWFFVSFDAKIYDGVTTGYVFPFCFIFLLISLWAVIRKKGGSRTLGAGSIPALLAAYFFWGATARQSRFLLPVFWGVCTLGVTGIAAMTSPLLRKICVGALIVLLIASLPRASGKIVHHYYAARSLGAARQYPLDFASRAEPGYAALIRDLRNLPADKKIAFLVERRTLYAPANVTILMPCFQEKLTPVPEKPEELAKALEAYDYLVLRLPAADVDHLPEYDETMLKLYQGIAVLQAQGKWIAVPGVHSKILRQADAEEAAAGTAQESRRSSSARVESVEASLRSAPENPRPLR